MSECYLSMPIYLTKHSGHHIHTGFSHSFPIDRHLYWVQVLAAMDAASGNTDIQTLNRAISFSLHLNPVVGLLAPRLFPHEFSGFFSSSSVKNAISVYVELSLKLR